MSVQKMAKTVAALFAAFSLALGVAPTAMADGDMDGYVRALEQAELIVPGGNASYEFLDGNSAAFTGDWVCQQVAQGRSRGSIVDDLNHSDGMLLSPQDAAVIYDAATSHLC